MVFESQIELPVTLLSACPQRDAFQDFGILLSVNHVLDHGRIAREEPVSNLSQCCAICLSALSW
jgi:hypothetical protein